jgi:DNA-binding ferritin-like protein (Dps family)
LSFRTPLSATVNLSDLSEDAALHLLSNLLEDATVERAGTVEVTGVDVDNHSDDLLDVVFFAAEMLTELGVTVRLS